MHTSYRTTLQSRKPVVYHILNAANHGGILAKNPDASAPRRDRWRILTDWGTGTLAAKSFPSKRAAMCFFETGETFKTNPIFAIIGGRRSQKRIR